MCTALQGPGAAASPNCAAAVRVAGHYLGVADSENLVIEAWSPKPASIRELVLCFLRAVERFREQDARATDPVDRLHSDSLARAALFEALNWADTVDQYLSAGPRETMGTDRDPTWAEGLPNGQERLVVAFQRVRNLTHHQWWQAVGVRMSRAGGRQVNEWFWAPLPVGRRAAGGGKARDEDAAFEERLAGRRVLTTLDELAAVFFARRTWEIARDDVAQPGHGEVGSPLAFDPAHQ